jgi:isopenicillin-N N-acyltransferase-like protein
MYHRFPLFAAALALIWAAGCTDEAFEPRREAKDRYTIVWLKGSSYEMGYQHGQLLRQELAEGAKEIEKNLLLKGMFALAKDKGYVELARQNSYPWILEECRGMVAAVGDVGWTEDHCLVLNFGDVIAEFVRHGEPKAKDLVPGCSQFVATGEATADGRLYHGRVLDWANIDFIVKYPVIFVRQPTGGVAHAVIGFPGNLSPYQGINAEGIAVASNEITPKDNTVNDRTGRSHVQLVGELLTKARSLGDARSIVSKTNHMSLELLVVSDGTAGEAEVLEMAPQHVGTLKMKDGVVYATNHFRDPKTSLLDNPSDSSTVRLNRLSQLLPKGASASVHGTLSPKAVVSVLRDRINATTGAQSAKTVIDDNKTIATNGALYEVLFDPAARTFWVAAGALPVPVQPFTGFSLGELLGEEDAELPPALIP